MTTCAVLPAGTLPASVGVLSLVRLSPSLPLSLGAAGCSAPVTVALVASVRVLSASAPSVLALPAASLNLSLATLMVALLPVAAGVKVAVYLSGLLGSRWKLPSVPPVTATSAAVKSLTASERVKVSVVLWPEAKAAASLVMATAGGTVSMVKGVRL